MTKLRYVLYTIAAALMAAANSIKDSADNVPPNTDADSDGVIDNDNPQLGGEQTNNAPPSVDSAGLPWDERIHSGAKSIKADGTWTKKKGATPPLVAQVEAELRAKLTGGAAQQVQGVQLPTPGLPTPGVPVGITPPVVNLSNYQKLCQFLAAHTGPDKGGYDKAWVDSALAAQGTSLAALAADDVQAAGWLKAFSDAIPH